MEFPVHIVAAGGIVENGNNEILLVKQTDRRAWSFPGGQVEEGENLINAVIREIKEESGVNVTVNKLVAVLSNTSKREAWGKYKGTITTRVIFDFICSFIDGELCTSNETSEAKWVKKEDVLNYITVPILRERYQTYLDFNGTVKYMEVKTTPVYDLKLKRDI
jgi:ADP-ribose pyrophosphatase YjhB (NUDIX family)